MFSPNGFWVWLFTFLISSRSLSFWGNIMEAKIPIPPASDTAATRLASETHIIPPQIMGCSIPRISVAFVLNI